MANVNQPIYILPEDTQRFLGRDAQRMNILAGKVLAETIRTTLGPKGMDKMLTDNLDDIVITNDGATILQEMDIAHPAAKMIVEIAKKQESVVGDGTTTAVIIAGELLAKAEELLDEGIHSSTIILGYRDALSKVYEILNHISIDAKDKETLLKVAMTAITGKGFDYGKKQLANLIVDGVLKIEENGKVDKDNLNIQRVSGGSIDDSKIINGVLIDKGRAVDSMPKKVENAKIALLKYPIELKDLESDGKIKIKDPSQIQAFIDNEEEMIKDLVNKVIDSGANVLFSQKGIDDLALHYLSKAGIFAIKRVKKSDIKRLEKATGAKLVTSVDDLNPRNLGEAGVVYEKKIFDEILTFVEESKNPKASSIILRGSTKYVTSKVERALDDGIGVVSATLEDGKVVIGGGSSEIEIAQQLKKYASAISGREQLAIEAYGKALEVVPKTLAENAGLDSIDILVDLRAAHDKSKCMGLNIFEGKIIDMKEAGIIEPQRIKKQAIQSATEVTEMILRIDDLVAAKGGLEEAGADDGLDNSGMPPGGMPGGMPPMM
ncbi:MAG: TCP-1/cpn60 chaperonin family protein [Methanobrevibacter sp.]|jgi:thermosome|nr:TCP-1/cpn60 chaperonin family protein [Candidatus Methanovirga basalitermitum]